MASDDEEGTKGNRKRVPIWTIVKNASFAITACFFILLIVLSLDAYKFISVRQAKFARKKLLTALQYMDPSIIEAHTGMKVLTKDEYANLTSTLEKGRAKLRELRLSESKAHSELNSINQEIAKMKSESEELTVIIAEKKAEAAAASAAVPPAAAAVPAAVAAADLSKEELEKLLAAKTNGTDVAAAAAPAA